MISLDTGLWQRGLSRSFSPLSLSPALWLDASDSTTLFQSNGGAAAAADGDPVGYWMDKSGNGRHLTQTSGTNKPLLNLLVKNGKSGISFNGTSSYFNTTSYMHGSSITSFCVIHRPASGGRNFAFADNSSGVDYPFWWENDNKFYVGNSSRIFISSTSNTNTGFFIVKSSYSTTSNMQIWLNGSSVSGSVSGTATSAKAWDIFGKVIPGSAFSTGKVLENIIFPSVLSATDITSMETYLNAKWAVY